MRRIFGFSLLLLVVVLAGCNAGISSDAAAKAFVNAVYSGNTQGARDVLCTSAKSLIGDDTLDAFSQIPVDTSRLNYSVRDATDTSATVVVNGNVTVGTGESSQEMDFATMGGPLTSLRAVVEDSAWKICPTSLNLATP
jgi:hypothetical protein